MTTEALRFGLIDLIFVTPTGKVRIAGSYTYGPDIVDSVPNSHAATPHGGPAYVPGPFLTGGQPLERATEGR